ncbi:MAG: CTP synthase, partial [Acholeplasmataceae bacterium]|nr:CTP synthase [Acholeplasmataceae bacterium]
KMPVITLRKEGKMKLGSSEVEITNGTRIYDVYQKTEVSERYRHRYQFNKKYLEEFKNGDLVWSGFSKKGTPVAMELKGHPFFIAVQYRPEFKSRPNRAHPLFGEFIKACYENKR